LKKKDEGSTNMVWLIGPTFDMAHGAEEEGVGKNGGIRKLDTNAAYSADGAEGTVDKIASVCTARTPLWKIMSDKKTDNSENEPDL
jgi:hypothetical protein